LTSAAIAMILLAAGCGGSDSSAAPAEATTTTTDQPTPAATVADDTVVESDVADAHEIEPDAAPEVGPEMIQLGYWEGVVTETLTQTVESGDECDTSDPDRVVCDFETSFETVGTHIGRARDVSRGTRTTLLSESCEGADGATGTPTIREAEGTITTAWGDELFFRNHTVTCSAALVGSGYWTVVGGTGRFEGAHGEMSAVAPVLESGYLSISVGTLTVQADKWEEILP
jgi:hypothetical protein